MVRSFDLFAIAAVNDNEPLVNVSLTTTNFTENQPLSLFPELILSDEDQFCDNRLNTLSMAEITLSPVIDDTERLVVSIIMQETLLSVEGISLSLILRLWGNFLSP